MTFLMPIVVLGYMSTQWAFFVDRSFNIYMTTDNFSNSMQQLITFPEVSPLSSLLYIETIHTFGKIKFIDEHGILLECHRLTNPGNVVEWLLGTFREIRHNHCNYDVLDAPAMVKDMRDLFSKASCIDIENINAWYYQNKSGESK